MHISTHPAGKARYDPETRKGSLMSPTADSEAAGSLTSGEVRRSQLPPATSGWRRTDPPDAEIRQGGTKVQVLQGLKLLEQLNFQSSSMQICTDSIMCSQQLRREFQNKVQVLSYHMEVICHKDRPQSEFKNLGNSLVVQQLRTYLAMQGAWV